MAPEPGLHISDLIPSGQVSLWEVENMRGRFIIQLPMGSPAVAISIPADAIMRALWQSTSRSILVAINCIDVPSQTPSLCLYPKRHYPQVMQKPFNRECKRMSEQRIKSFHRLSPSSKQPP